MVKTRETVPDTVPTDVEASSPRKVASPIIEPLLIEVLANVAPLVTLIGILLVAPPTKVTELAEAGAKELSTLPYIVVSTPEVGTEPV